MRQMVFRQQLFPGTSPATLSRTFGFWSDTATHRPRLRSNDAGRWQNVAAAAAFLLYHTTPGQGISRNTNVFPPQPLQNVRKLMSGLEQRQSHVCMFQGEIMGNLAWNHSIFGAMQDQSPLAEIRHCLISGRVL